MRFLLCPDVEASLWKFMYENPTHAFNFSEGILAMGGLSPLYSCFYNYLFDFEEVSLWSLLQADVK
ncbi:hypothetical protein Hanom_Chr16g01425891 [Helianthus anomalus]